MTRRKAPGDRKKRGSRPGQRQREVYPTDETKVCTRCDEEKPLGEFYTRGCAKDGYAVTHSPECRKCGSRAVVRGNWKRRLEKEGEGCLVDRIASLEKDLYEAQRMLGRWREGLDVVNW